MWACIEIFLNKALELKRMLQQHLKLPMQQVFTLAVFCILHLFYLSVFFLSRCLVSLTRPCFNKNGSHAFSLNSLVSEPYIICSLVAGYSDGKSAGMKIGI